MYVEMTTFAIPTFLIEGIKYTAIGIALWVFISIIGISIYWWTQK